MDAGILSKKEYHRQYYQKNKERIDAQNKEWAAKNREKSRAIKKKWSDANPEKQAAAIKKWVEKNKERDIKNKKEWASKNKDRIRILCINRRRKLSGGSLSKDITSKLLKLQNGCCAACKKELNGDFHIDHIIPVALGGKNIDNNVQLLHSSCNLKKNAKHPVDFMQELGFLL